MLRFRSDTIPVAAMTSRTAPVRRQRIIICTADTALRADLGDMLDQNGFTVVWARDSDHAMFLMGDLRFAAMVCDQALPDHDGIAFLQQIRRERPDLGEMPIIVLSEFAEPSDMVAGRLAGADDYLVKPVDHPMLVASLEVQIRQAARVRLAVLEKESAEGRSPRLNAAFDLMDRLSFGIELFDAQGHEIFCNRAARGLPRTNADTIRGWVARHVGQANRAESSEMLPGPGVLDFRMIPTGVSHSNTTQHLFVVILALTDPGEPETVFAATTFASAHWGYLGGELVAEAIGLTPTESRLAAFLAEGMRLDEIGEMMSIARPTVNYHLRNIYQKSGASRQSDVINLLRAVHLTDAQHLSAHPADGSRRQIGGESRS
ncbi:DNA-binding response regulator [Paracoccus aurantiacus]|uniref:DNA-binding response regulator n=1 Tax=Paracoccus aurantiacus TaxID=2599412 RepID=A0A5C6RWS7_9RHOB|nr:response regulator [Paracoccus aurantiacus]TXB66435.1 DNA-binding response regulator [Paracoccus aurantiacus]